MDLVRTDTVLSREKRGKAFNDNTDITSRYHSSADKADGNVEG